jgi:hypothetical protein
MVPLFIVIRPMEEEPGSAPAAITTATRQYFTAVSRPTVLCDP